MTPAEKVARLRWKAQAKRREAWAALQAQSPEAAAFILAMREAFGPLRMQSIVLNGQRRWP